MDLKQFDVAATAEKGVYLVLEHPVTGEELDAKIKLIGRDSSRFRNKMRDIAQKAAAAGKKRKTVDLEKADREGAELLAACTLGWVGIEEEGKPVPFSEAEAVRLYTDYRWIREQVDAFIADRANFFPS